MKINSSYIDSDIPPIMTATEYRNQIIRDLIEKAEAECYQDPETGVRLKYPGEDAVSYGVRLKYAEGAAEWLKSQLEDSK